ncbi:hypothetical protein TPY_1240 [Sulfobacillus acidophilus TPY]|nr:hypothetical protein TPY_1240 [Sulfobacillus acidophilus TPY]
MPISYRAHGDHWGVLRNGIIWHRGTVEDARQMQLTAHKLLQYGRPYLSPQANAHLWLWLNPPIWAYSFDLVLNVGYVPGVLDAFPPDAPIVHLVAAPSWDPHTDGGAPAEVVRYWWATAWDREQELTDYAHFFSCGSIVGPDFVAGLPLRGPMADYGICGLTNPSLMGAPWIRPFFGGNHEGRGYSVWMGDSPIGARD